MSINGSLYTLTQSRGGIKTTGWMDYGCAGVLIHTIARDWDLTKYIELANYSKVYICLAVRHELGYLTYFGYIHVAL